jgi:cytochrome P450
VPQYLKKGTPVVIPVFTRSFDVFLPESMLKWYISQPDSVMSNGHAICDTEKIRYPMGSEKVILDPWQGMVVKVDLNKTLESLCAVMQEELHVSIDKRFGTDTHHWKEVDIVQLMPVIIAQAATRFTFGTELCEFRCAVSNRRYFFADNCEARNDDYLQLILAMNESLVMNAGLANMVPRPFRQLASLMYNQPFFRHMRRFKRYVMPIWKQRVAAQDDSEAPEDIVQMLIRYGFKHRPQEMQDDDLMAKRLVTSNFGAVHQTGIQAAQLILDVIASDSQYNTVAVLRDEIDRVFGKDDRTLWKKSDIARLSKHDSLCRESMRLHSFAQRSVMRQVMCDGVEAPGGWPLPKGTNIPVVGEPAQTDRDLHGDDADELDPWRFSRLREDALTKGEEIPSVAFVSTGPNFLPFSYGRHACPGRFLVDFELKMILAYILSKYDLKFHEEYNGKRPSNRMLGEALFPPASAKVLVKRRQL